MRLRTRLLTLETRLYPPQEPPLRIILVDEDGRWWNRDEEIAPASIGAGTRVILLRYRAADAPRCA